MAGAVEENGYDWKTGSIEEGVVDAEDFIDACASAAAAAISSGG
jgi:hypothetical protein